MKQLVHSLPFKIYLTKFDLKKKKKNTTIIPEFCLT